jgi:hypothetical protein
MKSTGQAGDGRKSIGCPSFRAKGIAALSPRVGEGPRFIAETLLLGTYFESLWLEGETFR